MTARDLVLMDIRNGVCCGAHKPSSEKGVHLAAYQIFPEVGYVIHTHQTYATAIGLCGFEQLAMTEEEAEKLGGIARAAYGLSSRSLQGRSTMPCSQEQRWSLWCTTAC